MTSKTQLHENRDTLPVLGQENLKQVLFFSVNPLKKTKIKHANKNAVMYVM